MTKKEIFKMVVDIDKRLRGLEKVMCCEEGFVDERDKREKEYREEFESLMRGE